MWYPEDYWEIGLLPEIDKRGGLYPDGDTDREERTKILMDSVMGNLVKLGLNSVADLKNNNIYSKRMLEEYITTNHLKF